MPNLVQNQYEYYDNRIRSYESLNNIVSNELLFMFPMVT